MPPIAAPSFDLLSAAIHAFAGPLLTGKAACDALVSRLPNDPDAEQAQGSVQRAAVVLDGLVRLRTAMRTPFPEPVALDDTLRVALRKVAQAGAAPEVEAGPLPTVDADRDLVILLLVELLANVAQHAGPRPRARVRAETTGDGLTLIVADAGVGLPPTVDRARPAPFSHTSGSGAGCGLAVVAAVAAGAGGHLELGAADPGGAEARIVLPAGAR